MRLSGVGSSDDRTTERKGEAEYRRLHGINGIHKYCPCLQNVVFFVDCWHTRTSRFTKAHVKIFSYPKLKGDHTAKSIDACVYPSE